MATLEELERLARKIVGRHIEVQRVGSAHTDGNTISMIDPDKLWPDLPESAREDIDRFVTGHEASHIAVFDKEAKKRGIPGMSAEDFYKIFADPLSPGVESTDYVRFLLNVVEDRLVDNMSAHAVGENRRQQTNRFFVWNRQGGKRPALAQFESRGNPGKCAAFIEAIFQLEVYGELVESFYSQAIEQAAKEAVRAIDFFGQGSLSRTQALQRVLDALKKYCPPPWSLPHDYQPPRGESPQQGGGQGQGQVEGSGSGQEGDQGDGQGEPGDGQADGQNGQDGQPGSESSQESDGQSDQEGKKGEEEQESEGSGQGNPSESQSRGIGENELPSEGTPVPVQEKRFEDEDLEALLKTLERVLAERARESGRGNPIWRTWSPGDQISSPDEIQRYWEDETFGINPLERRAVRQRQQKKHLLAILLDSSGSVGDELFAMLYRVCDELAEKVADIEGCYLGVGQFSGGAAWVLEPTRNVSEIRDFAEQEAVRLFHGGTVVGEIYKVVPTYFAQYQTADLVVLTDGYVESGKELAESLEQAHDDTGCQIKLHGVVFRGCGSIKQFEKAKDELPQFVRVWHIGKDAA